MSEDSPASYYFLPWVRYGLLKSSGGMPELGKNKLDANSLSARLKINVDVHLKQDSVNTTKKEKKISKELPVFGPGDVIGIDPREIVRTEPRHLTNDFPPHLLPFIEFDRPDFPWLFTPGKPDSDECLRPWLVLVVLSERDWEIVTDPTKPLPYLIFKGDQAKIGEELPDLEESWAWAHAQYVGGHLKPGESIADELTNIERSHQNLSRLICPRRLKKQEHYLACVVPAFAAGRQAGLGELDINANLEPAWKQSNENEIKLPVYYHWEFYTRAEGDFEEFIDQLKHTRDIEFPTDQSRLMKVTLPASSSQAEAVEIPIPSALLPNKSSGPEIDGAFSNKFWEFVKASQPNAGNTSSSNSQIPLPIYGSWHNAENTPPDITMLGKENLPKWLKTLNSDPRYRVAAALGTQVIQRQQEQLMAAAWEKVTGIQEVNQWLKQKQLARDVTQSIYSNRLIKLSEDVFEQVTAPLDRYKKAPLSNEKKPQSITHSARRAAYKINHANLQSIAESELSRAFVSASYRRIARLQARIERKLKSSEDQSSMQKKQFHPEMGSKTSTGGFLARIRSGQLQLAPPPGVTAFSKVLSGYQGISEVRSATEASQKSLATPITTPQQSIREDRLKMIDPFLTFNNEVINRLVRPEKPAQDIASSRKAAASTSGSADPIQPDINVLLEFKQPMYEPLRDLFQNMLVPGGLDQIPNNSISVMATNAAFIEAYMVGLNHEMSRELLWREYPTHLNNTFFKQFWDVRGSVEQVSDINEIPKWDKDLGNNMDSSRGKNLFMLLIKSDLLLRYPNTIISARKAAWDPKNNGALIPDDPQLFPSLRINPVPGVTLMGFDLGDHPAPNEKITNNNLGWFFVIEEHPTEIRFGLDLSNKGLTSWHELAWSDVKQTTGGYISIKESNPELISPKNSGPEDPELIRFNHDKDHIIWGKNSSHMAYILLQKAYKIQIHSSTWFPDPAI